jgi:hypothetical protein
MIVKSALLTASLCIGAWVAPATVVKPSDACAVASTEDGTGLIISGALGAYVHGPYGYTYFMLGDLLIRIPTSAFPYPAPEFGTYLFAYQCWPVNYGGVDYACSSVSWTPQGCLESPITQGSLRQGRQAASVPPWADLPAGRGRGTDTSVAKLFVAPSSSRAWREWSHVPYGPAGHAIASEPRRRDASRRSRLAAA